MKGLILKDILIIKNNIRFLLISILLYLFIGYSNNADVTYFIPFMTFMLIISTFSYDDYNKWHAYAITIPNGRKKVVRAKYISLIILTLLSSVIGLILSYILGTFNQEILSSICGSFLAICILASILFPIIFKYGSEKGRISILIIFLGLTAIISVLSNVIKIKPLELIKVLIFLEKYGMVLIPLISVIIIFISYKVSEHIYMKKEF